METLKGKKKGGKNGFWKGSPPRRKGTVVQRDCQFQSSKEKREKDRKAHRKGVEIRGHERERGTQRNALQLMFSGDRSHVKGAQGKKTPVFCVINCSGTRGGGGAEKSAGTNTCRSGIGGRTRGGGREPARRERKGKRRGELSISRSQKL